MMIRNAGIDWNICQKEKKILFSTMDRIKANMNVP